MHIQIPQQKLSAALQATSRVATTTKTILPILNNVLISTEKSQVTITATNLEIAIIQTIPAKVKKPGTVAVPALLLSEFVRNLPKGDVTIESTGNNVRVSAGQYRSTINGIDPEEFPELPSIDEQKSISLTLPADEFREAIPQTTITGSTDTTRPALTGIYFNTNEKHLCLAATDGYRLSERTLSDPIDLELFAIIPISSLQEVLRLVGEKAEEIQILMSEDQAKFRIGQIEITSKIIDSSFPNYRQLIPEKTDINLKLDREEFLRVTKLAGIFARESGGSIVLETNTKDNTLSISSVANELGENISKIDTKVNADGRVTLSSKFLIDALNNVHDPEIHFGFSGKLAPVVIKSAAKSSNYIHIIMPLKS